MRFYASDDWNAKVNFTINGAVMGSSVLTSSKADIEVLVDDAPADKIEAIKIMFGKPGSKLAPTLLNSNANKKSLRFKHVLKKGQTFYYYLVILQKGGDRIYTAPIWVLAR